MLASIDFEPLEAIEITELLALLSYIIIKPKIFYLLIYQTPCFRSTNNFDYIKLLQERFNITVNQVNFAAIKVSVLKSCCEY